MAILCATCNTETIDEVVQENKRYYFCSECNKLYDRAIDSRYGKDMYIAAEQGLYHLSAGALIWKDDTFLLVKRRGYPFGYAFPAGHVECNEKPKDAVKREILEELGLTIDRARLTYEGEIQGDECRYGADDHYWYFYECQLQEGIPFINSESESIGWYTKDEAQKLPLIPAARFLIDTVVVL